MNNKYNQGFSSVDILGVGALFSLVVLVSWPIVARQLEFGKMATARLEAEKIATQNIRTSPTQKDARTPSSLDEPSNRGASDEISLGNDPWNHPYHLRILRNAYGQEAYRVVWSPGANGINETENSILIEKIQSHDSNIFGGDDVGFVERIR